MKRHIFAFGLNADGQLAFRCADDASFIRSPQGLIGAPQAADDGGGNSIKQLACGERHTLLLADDGKMWSFGSNASGQLGRGHVGSECSSTIYPVDFSASCRIVQVAAGRAHNAAVAEDGRLFTWGANESGQLGLAGKPDLVDRPRRVQMNYQAVQVACGPDRTIFLCSNGHVCTMGKGFDGQSQHLPTTVTPLLGIPISRIAAGGHHLVALSISGGVFTWGQNEYGQLGTGNHKRRVKPGLVESMSSMKVIDVACGDAHTVLLTTDGRVFTFGSDSFGQLGFGRRSDCESMPKVPSDLMGTTVLRVGAGRCHTIAVVNGKVYTFGLNSSGQLGNGTTRNQFIPKAIQNCEPTIAVYAGYDQTFIVRANELPKMIPGSSCEFGVPTFLLKQFVHTHLSRKEKLDLLGVIEAAFSALSVLNGSFVYNDERRFCVSERNSGIDLDDVMEVFNELAESTDGQQYSELTLDRTKQFLFEQMAEAHHISPESLRVFLILPWSINFVQQTMGSFNDQVQFIYCRLFQKLEEHSRLMIQNWWSQMPARHFNRVVSGLIGFVSWFVKKQGSGEQIVNVLKTLRCLSDINIERHIIPLENFYVPIMNEKIDIKSDYVRWVRNSREQTAGNAFFWSEWPFLLNGVAKGDLLHVEAALLQQEQIQNVSANIFGLNVFLSSPIFQLKVRRDHIVTDTISCLEKIDCKTLLKPLRVEFVGEEGEDGGGLRKEFFMLLFPKLLQPEYGMFVEDPESHLVWFSGCEGDRQAYQMIGALFALAVYNNVLVDFPFPQAIYKMILNQGVSLDDFCELHPVEGKSLHALLDYEEPDFEDVFCLNFTVNHTLFGHPHEVELKHNGRNIPVTQHNKVEYVQAYVSSKLEKGMNNEIANQITHFKHGFSLVLNSRVINLFQPRELMELVVGNEQYDWDGFKKVITYEGVYHARHPAILCFWDAFQELNLNERKKFLQFLTGSTRLPVQGMKSLNFKIQPSAAESFPAAHTCANTLDLPNIEDRQEMLRRLRVSLQHTSGFTLV